MQIQPTPAPLAHSGPEGAGRPQEGPTVTKSGTPRPGESVLQRPAPRFRYPEPNRGQTGDIAVGSLVRLPLAVTGAFTGGRHGGNIECLIGSCSEGDEEHSPLRIFRVGTPSYPVPLPRQEHLWGSPCRPYTTGEIGRAHV